jgi:hypothetical protein
MGQVPSSLIAYSYVPLTLSNNASGALKVQLALVNGGGSAGAGSAIDFFTYTDAGNGNPGLRIAGLDDGAFSGNFQIITKAQGGAGSGALTTKLHLFGGSGNLILQSGGTFTDAGYRLDVNGTARVQGDLKLKSNSSLSTGFNTARTSLVSTDTSGNGAFFDLYGSSGTAGTVDLGYAIFAKGVPSAITNSEVLEFKYDKTLRRYSMNSIAFGTGTVLPIALYTGTNTNQLSLFTTGNVGINTTTDAEYKLDVNGTVRIQNKLSVGTPTQASAVMEITSTTLGFLPPRMTTTQKNAITSPASGLIVYDTTLNVLTYYNGTTWI